MRTSYWSSDVCSSDLYTSIGPYRGFHATAVGTAPACKIDKQGLIHFFGIGQRFIVIKEGVQPQGRMEQIRVLFLAGGNDFSIGAGGGAIALNRVVGRCGSAASQGSGIYVEVL